MVWLTLSFNKLRAEPRNQKAETSKAQTSKAQTSKPETSKPPKLKPRSTITETKRLASMIILVPLLVKNVSIYVNNYILY